jgi:hypothetical protein
MACLTATAYKEQHSAIAYNADFTQAVPSDPVEIIILPTLSATTGGGGGTVAVDPPAGACLSNGTTAGAATPAQDFHAALGLGQSERTIATVHAGGVALAAIQGLNRDPHRPGKGE